MNDEQTLTLSSIFTRHMVLQRETPIRIWGMAANDSAIKAKLISQDGRSVSSQANADAKGRWAVTLPAQTAGGPYELIVTDSQTSITLSDVLIGDLWLASGQSNMEWKLHQEVENWREAVADSNYPAIRFFEVKNDHAATPQTEVQTSAGWQLAHPDVSASFSAVAWFFAKSLHLDKSVPIGIIDSTWGGTPAEAWTSATTLEQIPGYAALAKDVHTNSSQWQHKFDENDKQVERKYQLIFSEQAYQDGKVLAADFDDNQWHEISLPNKKPLSEIAWLRREFTLSTLPERAELQLGRLDKLGRVFLNGNKVYEQYWTDFQAKIPISPADLKIGNNTLVIRVIDDWDNQVHVGKQKEIALQVDGLPIDLSGSWRFSNTFEAVLPATKRYNWLPGVLFNAMIQPLTMLPIKGVIWYQGESNVAQADRYSRLFKGLITDWRTHWQQPELPFVFTQLASFNAMVDKPRESAWAELRQAQASALDLPHTAMAVTLDIGDADDIHPRNKQDVGKRLFIAAKHAAYADDITYSGPTFTTASYTNEKGKDGVLLRFEFDEGLNTKTAPTVLGFSLAGEDGVFVNAHAAIHREGVFVHADGVVKPIRIRYGWADNSPANLYNSAGLPAVPFQHGM